MKYIIGVGSWINGDDAIGLYLAEEIYKRNKEKDLEIVLINQDLISILFYLNEDAEKILIIDALKCGIAPGDFKIFSLNEVEDIKEIDGFSTHEGNLLALLKTIINLKNINLNIKIMGIEPFSFENKGEISEVLKNKLNIYIDEALKEIQSP